MHLGGSLLGALNMGFFGLIWIGLEGWYQFKLRKRRVKIGGESLVITLNDFTHRLKKGERLAIFDEFVINLEDYIYSHPGGEKVLIRNIGRDISKFFYGGYALGQLPWTHSYTAMNFLHSKLKIGKLSFSPVAEFSARIVSRDDVVSRQTVTITFKMHAPIVGV